MIDGRTQARPVAVRTPAHRAASDAVLADKIMVSGACAALLSTLPQ
jgi:hypothetical protein